MAIILNKKDKTFVIYILALNIVDWNIYPSEYIQIALLEIEKVTIPFKYIDYTNIFLLDFAVELPKHTSINNYFIDVIDDKQLFYTLIYSLELIKLKMLKNYIETNLANGFIKSFKSSTSTLILFIYKKNNNFQLYINYQDLNNLILQN